MPGWHPLTTHHDTFDVGIQCVPAASEQACWLSCKTWELHDMEDSSTYTIMVFCSAGGQTGHLPRPARHQTPSKAPPMCSISEAPPQQDSQGVGLYLLALALSVLVDIGLWGNCAPSWPPPLFLCHNQGGLADCLTRQRIQACLGFRV